MEDGDLLKIDRYLGIELVKDAVFLARFMRFLGVWPISAYMFRSIICFSSF